MPDTQRSGKELLALLPKWLRIALLVTALILIGEGLTLFILQNNVANKLLASGQIAEITQLPTTTVEPTTSISLEADQELDSVEQELTPTPALGIGSSQVSDVDGMMLMYVPEGEFEMGSEDGDSDEQPVHSVYLDAFWIDQTEVTNAQYELCVSDGRCDLPKNTINYSDREYGDHPVVYVDWNDASDYCQWAGRRLPTEAQWEKAARGMDGRTYPWGEEIDCSQANYYGCSNFLRTSPVGYYGEKGASPYGAYDMAGNAWEWVADWYSEDYYQSSPSDKPTGPDNGSHRAMRGGSWFSIELSVRSASRGSNPPGFSFDGIGFRCAHLP